MSWLVFACQGFAVSSVCLPRVCVGTKETIISLKSIKKGNKQQQCKPNSNIQSKEAEYYKICKMFHVNQSLDKCKQEWKTFKTSRAWQRNMNEDIICN